MVLASLTCPSSPRLPKQRRLLVSDGSVGTQGPQPFAIDDNKLEQHRAANNNNKRATATTGVPTTAFLHRNDKQQHANNSNNNIQHPGNNSNKTNFL